MNVREVITLLEVLWVQVTFLSVDVKVSNYQVGGQKKANFSRGGAYHRDNRGGIDGRASGISKDPIASVRTQLHQ